MRSSPSCCIPAVCSVSSCAWPTNNIKARAVTCASGTTAVDPKRSEKPESHLFTVIKLSEVVIYVELSKRGVDKEQEDRERDRATGFLATNNRESTDGGLTPPSAAWKKMASRQQGATF